MEQMVTVCNLCDDLFSTVDELRIHESLSHNFHEDQATSQHLRSCNLCNAPNILNDSNDTCCKCHMNQPTTLIKEQNVDNFLQLKINECKINSENTIQENKTVHVCGESAQKVQICNMNGNKTDHDDRINKNANNQVNNFNDGAHDIEKDQDSHNNHNGGIKSSAYSSFCISMNDWQNNEVRNIFDKKDITSDDLDNVLINCTVCDKIFRGKTLLNIHLRKHSSHTNKCRICSKEIFLQVSSKTSEIENSELIQCSKVCPHCKNIENYLNESGIECNFTDDDVSQYDYEFFKSKGLFPCPDCNRVFKREFSLKGHQYKHAAESICDHCGLPFYGEHQCSVVSDPEVVKQTSSLDSNNHNYTSKPTSSKSELICEICNKKVTTKDTLSKHMLVVHKKKYSYFCMVCQIHFYTSKVLTGQKFVVDGALKFVPLVKGNDPDEKIIKYDYELINVSAKKACISEDDNISVKYDQVCEGSDNDITNNGVKLLKRKYNKVSSLMKDFWENNSFEDSKNMDENHCRICHKTFCSPSNLKRHVKTHARLKALICDKCGKRFFKKNQFERHICTKILDKEKSSYIQDETRVIDYAKHFEETMCDASGNDLSKRVLTQVVKSHICEQCGKGFNQKENLKKHYIQKHSDGRYKTCPVCKKVLKGKDSYNSHISRMHPEVKNKKAPIFTCLKCGRMFNHKGNMVKHQLSHSNNLSFKCTDCNASFKYPQELRRHLLTHGDGPKYECHLCDKKFVLNFLLKKHINEYHGGIVLICKYCGVTIKRRLSMKRHLTTKHSVETEWQENPYLFIKSLATVSSRYVNVLTSDGPKGEIEKEVNEKDYDEVEDDENDAFADDNIIDDNSYNINKNCSGDDVDDSTEYGDSDENIRRRGFKRKKNDANDSDGNKIKKSDEDYHPRTSIYRKRKCQTKPIKTLKISTKTMRNSQKPVSNHTK